MIHSLDRIEIVVRRLSKTISTRLLICYLLPFTTSFGLAERCTRSVIDFEHQKFCYGYFKRASLNRDIAEMFCVYSRLEPCLHSVKIFKDSYSDDQLIVSIESRTLPIR